MHHLITPRLDLIPATLELLHAELESPGRLASEIGALVPEGWPPGEYDRPAIEHFEALVRKHPENTGWYSWYALRRANGSEPAVLIGAGGFFGPPTENATVEIGYSIVPTYERRGFASELVQALVTYALGTGTVHRIIAHTTPGNVGSIRVLEKSRFQFAGTGREPGTVQYTRLPADG